MTAIAQKKISWVNSIERQRQENIEASKGVAQESAEIITRFPCCNALDQNIQAKQVGTKARKTSSDKTCRSQIDLSGIKTEKQRNVIPAKKTKIGIA